MSNEGDGFVRDDDFGEVSIKERKPDEFKPWHKPRKQWVRSCQWKNSLLRLIQDKAEYNTIDVIHYFGFPGADCLDVRVLGKAIHGVGKKLCFYGLETDEENSVQAQSITESLLHDAPFISEKSKIEASSKFELLQNLQSKLTNEVRSRDPFHLVNLDFINSVFSGSDTMSALNNLLSYQFERQYSPWLLFLTTRHDAQANTVQNLEDYVGVLEENLNEHPDFKVAVNQNIFNEAATRAWNRESLLGHEEYFEQVFVLSFLKWILRNAHANNVRMKLLPIAQYKVRELGDKNDMCSFVIEFTKINNPSDATGINSSAQTIDSELDFAMRFIPRIGSAKDIDKLMENDVTLHTRMRDEMVQLLNDCGYNTEAYPF